MELLTKAAWVLLALIHLFSASVLFAPSLTVRLYGVEPSGDLGVLLVHRAALFAAVAAAALFAAFDPDARRLATLVVGISMIAFLALYAKSGLPEGSLRTIALADLVGLVPFAWVTLQAWRPG